MRDDLLKAMPSERRRIYVSKARSVEFYRSWDDSDSDYHTRSFLQDLTINCPGLQSIAFSGAQSEASLGDLLQLLSHHKNLRLVRISFNLYGNEGTLLQILPRQAGLRQLAVEYSLFDSGHFQKIGENNDCIPFQHLKEIDLELDSSSVTLAATMFQSVSKVSFEIHGSDPKFLRPISSMHFLQKLTICTLGQIQIPKDDILALSQLTWLRRLELLSRTRQSSRHFQSPGFNNNDMNTLLSAFPIWKCSTSV